MQRRLATLHRHITATRSSHVAAVTVDAEAQDVPFRLQTKQKYFEFATDFLPEDEAKQVIELAQKHGVWHMHSEGVSTYTRPAGISVPPGRCLR